jgi:chromosomal replication initiation ATPase DnaA
MSEQIQQVLNDCEQEISRITGKNVEVFFKYCYEPVILENIMSVVTKVCNVSYEDISGTCRKNNIVTARHLFFYIAVRLEKQTLIRVARMTNKDHTTVINGVRHVENMLFTKDHVFTTAYNDIICLLYPTKITA